MTARSDVSTASGTDVETVSLASSTYQKRDITGRDARIWNIHGGHASRQKRARLDSKPADLFCALVAQNCGS